MTYFHIEDIHFTLSGKRKAKQVITTIIRDCRLSEGDINIIFTSDFFLTEMNKKYLNHDYYTDIITFPYNSEKTVSGDLFISVERVKENATSYKKPFQKEVMRVIFHGMLHLVGYNDKTEDEKKGMREKEEYYLSVLAAL